MTITYNDAAGLRITVDSLKSLFGVWPASEWEHVVVDGSPALSRHVLDDLPAGWPLVHVEQSPGGVPHAFNEALAIATGAYIWFLNGGDALRDPAALSRVLGVLDGDRAVDFVCGGVYLSRDGLALYPAFPRRTLLGNILGRSWIYHQGMVYRRASLSRVGRFCPAYRAAGDYEEGSRIAR